MSKEIIDINEYKEIFSSIKNEILKSQYKAMQVVNKELIFMYWNIGKIILNNSEWGNKFIDNLAVDLKLEFPNTTGFSVRNLKYMKKMAEEYPDFKFVQQVIIDLVGYCFSLFIVACYFLVDNSFSTGLLGTYFNLGESAQVSIEPQQ